MQTVFGRAIVHFVAAAIALVWVGLFAGAAVSGQGKNASDGVYTAAQADRGQKTYEETCAPCHETSQFTSNDFFANWGGKPLFELFDKVKTTMPEDNPGTLKPQQYADLIAYYLKLNEFAAGQTELKGDAEALKGVTLDKKK